MAFDRLAHGGDHWRPCAGRGLAEQAHALQQGQVCPGSKCASAGARMVMSGSVPLPMRGYRTGLGVSGTGESPEPAFRAIILISR